jgi:hypothetical protein
MSSYLITENEVVFVANGKPYQADKTHPNYLRILGAIKEQDWEAIPNLMDRASAINKFGDGKITVVGGEVLWNGMGLHNSLTERILTMIDEGFNVSPMVRFLENLMQNPSQAAIDELYTFLEVCKLPITEDGHFIAYKRVRDDFKSFHDGKTDNTPGTTPEMPRHKVDSDRNRTCSDGLHFCSIDYLGAFYSGNGKVVLLKINPRDVVSIPADYNNTKGRACRYHILSEVTSLRGGDVNKDVFNQSVVSAGATSNSQEYKEGYVFGYSEGHRKADKHPPTIDQTARYAGYLDGYKDGRGHNARKYTKQDL